MALIVRYGSTSLSSTLDQVANGFSDPKLSIKYDGPAQFTFRLHVPQHTTPIPIRSLIAFEDDTYAGYPNQPLFLGHVWEIIPQWSNEVDYICHDVTLRARNEITVMSGPHGDANVIPRLVFNSKIDNDEDYAYAYENDATVGSILTTLLTNSYNELLTNCQAAPLGGGSDAFTASDLTPLDYIPQEKVTFESELLGQAIDRLLSLYPQYRLVFVPGYTSTLNRWRFVKPTTSTQVTLTLNDFSASKKVLSFGLRGNIAQRYPAVKIFGPRQWVTTTVTVTGSGLTNEWTNSNRINFEENGPNGVSVGDAGKRWRIANSARRLASRILPDVVGVSDAQFNVDGTSLQTRLVREPTLQATWDGTTWWTIPGFKLDIRNGYIDTPTAVYQDVPSGTPRYKLPTDVRLIYAYFGDPIAVRFPSSGFSGTANSVAGMTVEKRIYDEMLAIGYEQGTPVTSAARQAQFVKLAESIHEAIKDIIYTGGCTLEGLDYDFLQLQRRVNFAAVNGNGGSLTTGWEAVNAIVTDVEYDYENQLTTLTFSSDYSAFLQTSIEELKRILKIRALQVSQLLETSLDASGQTISQTVRIRNIVSDNGEIVGEF
jgi:hypothetical protein